MSPTGKWIDGLEADMSVVEAARRSIDVRLRAVIYWLPLAAHMAERDIEHVHRLRVSTRRAMAALSLYHEYLPSQTASWIRKRLKRIRRAAGDARDLDVMGTRFEKDYGDRAAPLFDFLRQQRALAQPAIVDVADRARRNDKLVRMAAKLLKRVKRRTDEPFPVQFGPWAREKLRHSTQQFLEAVPDDLHDAVALHDFRIAGKALRYSIELVAPAFGAELRKRHYPVVEEVQERLGKIQDHAAARHYLQQWIEPDSNMNPLLEELAAEESERMAAAQERFARWWSSDRISLLRELSSADSTPPDHGSV